MFRDFLFILAPRMKIALAQLNYHIGNFESNTKKILDAIDLAKSKQADLIVFSELSICGYPPRDFLEFNDFVDRCEQAVSLIAQACDTITAIVGSPARNTNKKGKPLFNAAFVLANKTIQSIHFKTLLPTYDIFDEYRYFEPNREFAITNINGYKLAVTICEDIWNIDEQPMYVENPLDHLIKQDTALIINLSASPFHSGQAAKRKTVVAKNCIKYKCPMVYVNHVGAQTELLFDGGSLAYNADGSMAEELSYFNEDLRFVELDTITGTFKTFHQTQLESNPIALIYEALVMGIRDYFKKLGFSHAILGLSGGIDSAVTAALACDALGGKQVTGILMPSEFSSEHSIDDARILAENLQMPYDIIPISKSFEALQLSLSKQFKEMPFNLAEENLQARIRGVLLMALSNKFGYIVLNTSNKSEAAVGYGTLYGDMCGGIAVLGDLYKMQVYELANYINRNKEIIPNNSIIKVPSAELRPNQKDSDSLPEYAILDQILFKYIEERKGPSEIIKEGFDETLVKRVLKLVNTNEYKRHQTPPILRISEKAFGMGRRMPIVGKYLS